MTSIVHDYRAIAKAARRMSRSFDWYPNSNEAEPMFLEPPKVPAMPWQSVCRRAKDHERVECLDT